VQEIQSTGSRSRETDRHRRAVQMFDQFGATR
jgi:hypothetical protein